MHDIIFISQEKYAIKILKKFRMQDSKPTPTPIAIGLKLSKKYCSNNVNPTMYKRLVGSLIYLTTNRRDIMHIVSLISRFMKTPKESHC
jgi:hypothetical protein